MKKKYLIYCFSLLIYISVLLVGFHKVFSFKYFDGIYSMKEFYDIDNNTVDVLVLGSSHAFENINPMVIWEDGKIACYDLCGSEAPAWNSYYFLKEALKTQSPKLVVFEAFMLTKDLEYSDDSIIIKNIYGLKPSINKVHALYSSVPENRKKEFAFDYLQYHNRYRDLESSDYKRCLDDSPAMKYTLGFGNNYRVTSFDNPMVENDGTASDLPEKQEEYYKKIIDLCNEEKIDLLVMVTPYCNYDEEDMHYFNEVKRIANANGVKYVNFNDFTDEMDVNWDTDFADENHMNYIGNRKFSKYLTQYIVDNYSIARHEKKDEGYLPWEESTRYYLRSLINKEITKISDGLEYFDYVNNLDDKYTIVVQVDNSLIDQDNNVEIKKMLKEIWLVPIDYQDGDNQYSFWVKEDGDFHRCEKKQYGYSWAKRFGNKELLTCTNGIYFYRRCYSHKDVPINVVVFDEDSERVVDSIGLTPEGIKR